MNIFKINKDKNCMYSKRTSLLEYSINTLKLILCWEAEMKNKFINK